MKTATFLGLRSAIAAVPDLAQAKAWYGELLGIEPYFDQPFYVGFNVGGFELGLHPAREDAQAGPGGAVAYWGVERIDQAWAHAIGLGAAAVSAPRDVGEGIQVAMIADPFGNTLGLIENPHFPNRA